MLSIFAILQNWVFIFTLPFSFWIYRTLLSISVFIVRILNILGLDILWAVFVCVTNIAKLGLRLLRGWAMKTKPTPYFRWVKLHFAKNGHAPLSFLTDCPSNLVIFDIPPKMAQDIKCHYSRRLGVRLRNCSALKRWFHELFFPRWLHLWLRKWVKKSSVIIICSWNLARNLNMST